ncbi:hypothetical protein ACQ4PT_028743 [Festuca glaucescens]
MDAEAGPAGTEQLPRRQHYKNLLLLAYQSFGVVYGDLSTSPLYVYKSTFSGRLGQYQDEQTVFGVLSLIFWTFTLVPLLKYVIIVLSADDNGEVLSSMSGLQVRATGLQERVTVVFRDTTLIGNAYGIACMTVMIVTTFLMALIIIFVWQKNILFALLFLLFFGSIEAVYLSSSLMKVHQGGWVPLVLGFIFMSVMFIWHYGSRKKYLFDLQNKVSMRSILSLGPNLGIVRVPGIGLIYTELVTGVPAIFTHFVTNLPAFHEVLVFLCVKSVPVPYVPPDERYLVGRIGPRAYRMYRCIVRYGYKDVQRDDENFENMLVMSIAKFIMMEAEDVSSSASYDIANEGRMAVIRTTEDAGTPLGMRDLSGLAESISTTRSSKSESLRSLQSSYEQESPSAGRRRRVRFELPNEDTMDQQVKDELLVLVEAKHAGVAYIMGHSYIKARRSSSYVKKIVIDVGYSFLRKNCRGPSVSLHIPHISLIEVGMIYYV